MRTRRSPPPDLRSPRPRPPLTLIPFPVPQINDANENAYVEEEAAKLLASLTNSPNYQFWTGHYITSWDAATFNLACSSKASSS